MVDEYFDRTIAHLVEDIRQGEVDLAENKRVVNRLCVKANRPTIYPDADVVSGPSIGNIRRDQWYGQPISGAIREYLSLRRSANLGPASVGEIYDALCDGGFSFDAKDPENAKRGIRVCLTKSSSIFHRLPNGNMYGLLDWYPEAKARKEREPAAEPAAANGEDAATQEPDPEPVARAQQAEAIKRSRTPKTAPESATSASGNGTVEKD